MKYAQKLFFFAALFFCAGIIEGEVFSFKYIPGDSYRILSTVREDVFVNRRFDHHAEIVNRISVTIPRVLNGWGDHETVFMTSETSTGASAGGYGSAFSWGEEYYSEFRRGPRGEYDIEPHYYMPVVRNVPVFPDRDLSPGDSWTGTGEEVHDLRRGFGIEEPFHVPFSVQYTYTGTELRSGKKLHVIKARYSLYYQSPKPAMRNQPAAAVDDYPVTTMGFSDQIIYWNNEAGSIDSYSENFRIIMELASGNVFEFRGTSDAELTELSRTASSDMTVIQQSLNDLGIDNAVVTAGELGLTISLEDIRFEADSAVLLDSEKAKLRAIADILSAYSGNDLLITGHTAQVGSQASQLELSEERAASVGGYLIELGVRDQYHVFTRGAGAAEPVADNRTEEGRARNRRVEITVLEK